jgi:hypothetical protein
MAVAVRTGSGGGGCQSWMWRGREGEEMTEEVEQRSEMGSGEGLHEERK